jgi:hypothetical protein
MDIQQQFHTQIQDLHVGHHPALWGEIGGIAPGTGGQGGDVVGQQPLQIRRPVITSHGDPATHGQVDERRRMASGVIRRGRKHDWKRFESRGSPRAK